MVRPNLWLRRSARQQQSGTEASRKISSDLIYEASGVEEYGIVSPMERAVEIYYLKYGRYEIEESYILDDDETSEHYNLKQEITLWAFPVTMTLEDIFVF